MVLKGPSTVPSPTQQGFPNDEKGGGLMPVWSEKPVSEEEGTPVPLPTAGTHLCFTFSVCRNLAD